MPALFWSCPLLLVGHSKLLQPLFKSNPVFVTETMQGLPHQTYALHAKLEHIGVDWVRQYPDNKAERA